MAARRKSSRRADYTVRFVRPHRHAGRDYRPGDTARVSRRALEKLLRFGVIEPRGDD